MSFPSIDLSRFSNAIRESVEGFVNTLQRASNPKQLWQDECKKAYDAGDWQGLWNVMYAGAVGAVFQGKSVASYMLKNFLLKGGDVNWDYTDLLNQPIFPGFGDSWLKNAPSIMAVANQLDSAAKTEVLNLVKSGNTSGTVYKDGHVVQKGDVDGDSYYAVGKIHLKGEFKYSIETEWVSNKKYVKIERVYRFDDYYDWQPGAKGGILPHDYPIALSRNGLAKEFWVRVKFGQPEFKIYI